MDLVASSFSQIAPLAVPIIMDRDTILTLLFLVGVVALIVCSVLYKPVGFWNHQPVSWNKDGLVIYPDNTEIKLKEDPIATIPNHIITLKDADMTLDISPVNFEEVYRFLFNEFSNHYNIQYEYARDVLSKSVLVPVHMRYRGELVGFICAYPIEVCCKGRTLKPWYVDYLCVGNKYRNQNAAAVLIGSILNEIRKKDKYAYFLFKKDTESLPFPAFYREKYYLSDLRNSYIAPVMSQYLELTEDNWREYLEFINKCLKRYSVFREYQSDDFYRQFVNPATRMMVSIIVRNADGLPTILLGKKNIYKSIQGAFISFDVDIIVGEMKSIADEGRRSVRDGVYAWLKYKGYDFMVVPLNASTKKWIKDTNMKAANSYYYYWYNFFLPPVNSDEFALNIN